MIILWHSVLKGGVGSAKFLILMKLLHPMDLSAYCLVVLGGQIPNPVLERLAWFWILGKEMWGLVCWVPIRDEINKELC